MPIRQNNRTLDEMVSAISNAAPHIDFGYTNINNSQQLQYIHQYNYTPDEFIFHSISDEEKLYMGVELEVDCGGKTDSEAKYVCEYMNNETENVYCMSDGSIQNGFEIATHPMTLEYHKTLDYEGLFSYLSSKGYRSHDTTTCGTHVHVNRDYFGDNKLTQDLCISKLLYLFEKFWDKVELIARRKSNSYANRFYLNDNESPLDLYAKSNEKGKYGAINLGHSKTVEIRIFKGTLNKDTFINTLEFVNVMVGLAKDTDIYQIQFVTWEKIISEFSDKLNEYILEREEKQKEIEEKVGSTTQFNINNCNWDFSYISSALQNCMLSQGSSMCSDTYSTINSYWGDVIQQPSRLTEEEILLRKITDIKTKIRRSRNGLEITNLNRQLGQLERDLRDCRRRNN